jgi:hypothetical protein
MPTSANDQKEISGKSVNRFCRTFQMDCCSRVSESFFLARQKSLNLLGLRVYNIWKEPTSPFYCSKHIKLISFSGDFLQMIIHFILSIFI